MRAVLHGRFVDKTRLPEDFLSEMLRSGRGKGYSKVARGIYRSLEGFIRARHRFPQVSVPVTLVYSENDWSLPPERDHVASSLTDVQRITLPRTEPSSDASDGQWTRRGGEAPPVRGCPCRPSKTIHLRQLLRRPWSVGVATNPVTAGQQLAMV